MKASLLQKYKDFCLFVIGIPIEIPATLHKVSQHRTCSTLSSSKIMTTNRMRACHGAYDIYGSVVFDSAIPYSLIPPYVGNAHLFVQISWICVMSHIRICSSSYMYGTLRKKYDMPWRHRMDAPGRFWIFSEQNPNICRRTFRWARELTSLSGAPSSIIAMLSVRQAGMEWGEC